MSKIETSTITLAVGFHAPAELIWACFTDQNQMSGYTQTPCKLEPKEGGAISMMNGAITGQYKKLTPHSELVFTYKMKEWADDNVSTVTLTLEALSSAKTKLTLTQTDVPHDDKYGNHYQDDKVRGGWPQFFFSRINKVLGYANLDL